MSPQTSVDAATSSNTCNLVNPFEDINNVFSDSYEVSSISSFDLAGSTPESFAFRSSLDISHARRRAASFATATSYGSEESTENDPFSTNFTFRDSLEIVRDNVARKHARDADETESQLPLLSHKDSLDLPREQRAREIATKRRARALKATHKACTKAKALVGSALANIKGVYGSGSIWGRPIKVLHSTGHKMRSPDYDAYEHGTTRLEHLETLAKADGFSDVAAWCRLEGIRY